MKSNPFNEPAAQAEEGSQGQARSASPLGISQRHIRALKGRQNGQSPTVFAHHRRAQRARYRPSGLALRASHWLPSFAPAALLDKVPQRNALGLLLLTIALASSFSLSLRTRAQTTAPATSPNYASVNRAELHQALLDLTNAYTVMCVAAHPDDEDGTTLTVLRRKYGVHTVSLFTTFGEGGQNAVGPELYEELGVIRTEETIKASRIQGSEPVFLGMKDFGFSKSAEEAFRIWARDAALRRMVLKIRELRPDAIITNHDTTRGHGHHQATGQLIIEAFDAAADPKRFPEQLNQVKPWQAQRLFVRVFGGGAAQQPSGQTVAEKSLAIDPNEVDPVRETSYAEQALTALQQHASQGPWPKSMAELLRTRGGATGKLPLIRYRLVREAKGAPALPNNATNPLAGLEATDPAVAGGDNFAPPQIEGRHLTEFADQPDRVLATLIDWRATQEAPQPTAQEPHRLQLMEDRANKALGIAAGVSMSLSSSAPALVPSVNTTFAVGIMNSSLRTVQVNALRFKSWGEESELKAADQLLPDTETTVTVARTTPKTSAITMPREEHLYDGLGSANRFEAVADLEIDGAKFSLRTDLARDVAPAVEISSVSPATYVWTPATRNQPLNFKVTLVNHLETAFKGNLTIGSRKRRRFETGSKLSLGPLETREVTLKSNARPSSDAIRRRAGGAGAEVLSLAVEAEASAATVTERPIRMIYSDARVAGNPRVGFFPSFDDTLAKSLAALGVSAKELTMEDAQRGDLSAFQTVIIDNRGYEAHPELIAANSRLLEFVNAGGTLLVFYHKNDEWNPDPKKSRPQLAPFPIILGGERVTVETAPIKFIQPSHALLNYPNRIGPADFNDWIQERGLYYPKTWDAHYSALFSTNDPGETPLTGGLLAAQYGKGNYIYTSMVWYRQLRAGQPGAYRMFANMISYGHK